MSEKLVVVRGKQVGAKFGFADSPITVGSDAACSIQLDDASVQPRHLLLERVGRTWHLRAMDAANPFESGGRMLSELRLVHGATFRIGQTELRFVTPTASIEEADEIDEPFEDQEVAVQQLDEARRAILNEMAKIVVGQQAVIVQILTALLARGHCLLIGAPGLAKTLMVRTLAGTLDLDSKRIQFTPDLMPADITGTDILQENSASGQRHFHFNRGPIFTNILLADEINRTPPKTQAALLEAMQERRVTASGVTYDLARPFVVLATQNPIELEGTYPLPEAQLDRFMFSINVDYPTEEEEPVILLETTRDRAWEVDRVLDGAAILRFQHLVRQVPVSRHVAQYASALVRATRPGREYSPDFVSRWVRWGAGPRAGQYLLLAAKAHVLLNGRFNIACSDIREYARPVLRHRIFRNFAAASEGVSPDDIITRILETVSEPEY